MKQAIRRAGLCMLGVVWLACSAPAPDLSPRAVSSPQSAPVARPSLVLVVGDGMGPGQLALLLRARPEGGMASLLREGEVGLVDPTPFGALVTDSAAGGTALSTGVQTRPRMLALDPEGRPVETLLELARRQGYATGVVTTADITDATPAAFLAHSATRHDPTGIALQIAKAPPDIAVSGGGHWFPDSPPWLHAEAEGDLPYARAGRRSLTQLTEKARAVLEKSPAGYVLLVEGARIDDACHGHLAPELLGELLDLDDAIEALLPKARRGEFLLVVTADHETGGFALHYRPRGTPGARVQARTLPSGEVWDPGADFGREEEIEALLRGETPGSITWSTGTHTAALVTLGALGPGADKLRGLRAQWEVGRELRAWLEAESGSPQ